MKLFEKFDHSPYKDDLEPTDCIVFCGGTDVSPSLYGEKLGSHSGEPDTKRDEYEKGIYEQALKMGLPMIGICRGAQFLNVMNGGKLVQHCTSHAMGRYMNHSIMTYDEKVIDVTSTHHQMMIPSGRYDLLGWAGGLSDRYLNGDDEDMPILFLCEAGRLEPEVVWYPETRSLCIQGHPEYMTSEDEFWKYSVGLVRKFLLGEE
jgi:gamma-glutamyl-gamma-aminobutyrate hydrolase PuuD